MQVTFFVVMSHLGSQNQTACIPMADRTPLAGATIPPLLLQTGGAGDSVAPFLEQDVPWSGVTFPNPLSPLNAPPSLPLLAEQQNWLEKMLNIKSRVTYLEVQWPFLW